MNKSFISIMLVFGWVAASPCVRALEHMAERPLLQVLGPQDTVFVSHEIQKLLAVEPLFDTNDDTEVDETRQKLDNWRKKIIASLLMAVPLAYTLMNYARAGNAQAQTSAEAPQTTAQTDSKCATDEKDATVDDEQSDKQPHKAQYRSGIEPLINVMTDGKTSDQVIELLVPYCDILKKDSDGDTPLHLAVDGGELSLVKKLLAHGADPLAENNENETPLDVLLSNIKGRSGNVDRSLAQLFDAALQKKHDQQSITPWRQKIQQALAGNASLHVPSTFPIKLPEHKGQAPAHVHWRNPLTDVRTIES